MLKLLCGCVGVLALVIAGAALAEEIKGKVKGTDLDKNTITVTVNEKEQTVNVAKDAKIVGLYGKKANKAQVLDVPGGLNGVKVGANVTITTEKKDNKEVATTVKVEDLTKKKKGT